MKTRKKLNEKLKDQAKKMLESGFSFKDIHTTLGINLRTLYNLSSKEKWKRGTKNQGVYLQQITADIQKNRNIKTLKIQDTIKRTDEIKKKFDEIITLEDAEEIKIKTDSLEKLTKTNKLIHQIDKEIFNIRNETEELEFQLKITEYEFLKEKNQNELNKMAVEVELKETELKKNKIELRFKELEKEVFDIESD
ncbi:MAG: hypothetical protein ACRC4T_16530 [Cetobacterium sp.]